MTVVAYVALGSNLNQPFSQLKEAVNALERLPESKLLSYSSVYSSPAVGPANQPNYLNAVVKLSTELGPMALLNDLQAIEAQQGRIRSVRWGARTIDLDILLYGNAVISTDKLTIPHLSMAERSFVLYPLAEITPSLTLPNGAQLDTLLAACPMANLTRTEFILRTKEIRGNTECQMPI